MEDSDIVIKVDTIFTSETTWITGENIYYPIARVKPRPAADYLGFLAGSLILLVVSCGFYLRNLKAKKSAEKEAGEIVLSQIHDKVSIVRTLLRRHDAMHMKTGMTYMDELEALQDQVRKYDGYMEELRSNKQLIGELEKALDAGMDGIMVKTRKLFGNQLSEEDYHVLSCFYAGLDTSSISFITGIREGTLRTKKSRIKARLHNYPESSEKHQILSALTKEVK